MGNQNQELERAMTYGKPNNSDLKRKKRSGGQMIPNDILAHSEISALFCSH